MDWSTRQGKLFTSNAIAGMTIKLYFNLEFRKMFLKIQYALRKLPSIRNFEVMWFTTYYRNKQTLYYTVAYWNSMGRVVTQIRGQTFQTLGWVYQILGRAFQTLRRAFDFFFRLQKLNRVFGKLGRVLIQVLGRVFR